MPVKVACQACHGRRVKCDREEGTACSNCRLAGRHCEPFISRRGRYVSYEDRSELQWS